ncbi:HypC/HybG/HupF family hydrogenase formation chaperone [Noviherbaspirillum agri]
MAIPSKVIAIDGEMATVDAFGQQRHVSLMLLHEPVQLGDYLLIQAGGFAYERVEEAMALETLEVLSRIVEQADA